MDFHPDKQLFQVIGTGDRTTDPWITKPALYLYTMGDLVLRTTYSNPLDYKASTLTLHNGEPSFENYIQQLLRPLKNKLPVKNNNNNLQNLMKCCSCDQTPSHHYYLHPHLSLSTSRRQLLVALLGDSLAIKACSFPWNLDCFDVPCPLHSVIAAQKMRLSYIFLLEDRLSKFCLGDILENYL